MSFLKAAATGGSSGRDVSETHTPVSLSVPNEIMAEVNRIRLPEAQGGKVGAGGLTVSSILFQSLRAALASVGVDCDPLPWPARTAWRPSKKTGPRKGESATPAVPAAPRSLVVTPSATLPKATATKASAPTA